MTVDDELIAKYLSGEASPDEAMALNDWLEEPGNKIRFQEMEKTWNESYPPIASKAVNKEAAWRKIKPTRPIGWTSIGIAASVTIIVAVGVWTFFEKSSSVDLITAHTNDSTDHIALADNSQVTLYLNTSIEYPKEFSRNSREVKLLAGEAFFSVTKDPEKPFVVHASFADIKVVGTQFNVIMHNDAVEVGVNEGTVVVYSGTDSVYVRRGASVVVRSGQAIANKEMDANTWAYATRSLSFKDIPVEEVIKSVEKAYSCTITISNDNIKKCKLTATFDNDSLEKVLLLISESLNLKLEQNGQVYTLEGEGCP